MKSEKSENYYDAVYAKSQEYRKAPEDCIYFELWKKALDLIRYNDNILELGCGAGHFASMLENKFPKIKYYGVDFSLQALMIAKMQSRLEFVLRDIYETELYDLDYNTVVALEVFEHIDDLRVLGEIRSGVKLICTLPDFDDPAHLVYFASIEEIIQRYRAHLQIKSITKFKRWYIFEGVKI